MSSSELARQDSSISKYLVFVLFRRKGNGQISQRVLLTHISTLLTDLNDVWGSVCLDLDTKSKLSTNNVCWNHWRNLTKATGKLWGFSNYIHWYVLFSPLQYASLLKGMLNVNYRFRENTLTRYVSGMLLWCEKYLVLLVIFVDFLKCIFRKQS